MYQHVSKMRSARFLMTFLRDPIDRLISNYHFLRTRSPLSRYSEAALQAARSLSFKDFLLCDDRNVRMITTNFQTKALAHDIRPDVLDETMTGALLERRAKSGNIRFHWDMRIFRRQRTRGVRNARRRIVCQKAECQSRSALRCANCRRAGHRAIAQWAGHPTIR